MYISNEQTSTIVVTNGEEIRAGSFLKAATSIGSDVPTNFATKIPSNKVPLTNNEIDNEVGVFQFAFAKLKDQNIKYFLKKFSLSLVTYYKYYCNSKKRISKNS